MNTLGTRDVLPSPQRSKRKSLAMTQSAHNGHAVHEPLLNGTLNGHNGENSLIDVEQCITQKPGRFVCRCYLEPEIAGVSITYLQDELTLGNQAMHKPIPPLHSGRASSVTGSTGTRHSCHRTVLSPYSYALDSVDGYCLIELRALTEVQLKDVQEPINRPFKLNFQLVL